VFGLTLFFAKKAFFHALINDSYGPLLDVLPLSLADKTYSDDDGAPVRDSSDSASEEDAARTSGISAEIQDADPGPTVDDAPILESSKSAAPLSSREALPVWASGISVEEGRQAEDVAGPGIHGAGTNVYVEEWMYGFAHPAVSRPQRTVWIPQDALGLAGGEENECREAGVTVSTRNAAMDEKGKVSISGAPPDVRGGLGD